MNDSSTFAPAAVDDWLDAALRAQRAQAIADDGFAARVMAALPAPIAAKAPSWRRPVVMAMWTPAIVGIAFSLPGAMEDAVRGVYRVLTAYPVSIPELAIVLAAAAVVTWTAAGYAVKSRLAAEA